MFYSQILKTGGTQGHMDKPQCGQEAECRPEARRVCSQIPCSQPFGGVDYRATMPAPEDTAAPNSLYLSYTVAFQIWNTLEASLSVLIQNYDLAAAAVFV